MEEAIAQGEMNVDTAIESGPDFDQLQLQKNNKRFESFAETLKSVLDVKTEVDLKIQKHVETSVQSFYGDELKNKQDEIEKLRLQVIELETRVDENEKIIKRKEDVFNNIERELKWLNDKYDKKEQEIVALNTEFSESKENYQKYKKQTEEAEKESIKKEETIKQRYEKILKERERQTFGLKEETTTLHRTVSTLEAKFTIQYKAIIEQWSSWFMKFKEEHPKDLESLYIELSKQWKEEWTRDKEHEITKRVQSEQNMTIAKLKEEKRTQQEEIKWLKQHKQQTHRPEVLKYTALLDYLEKYSRASTTVGYTETVTTVTRATRVADMASTGESDDDVD